VKELIVGAGVAAALGLYLGDLAQPEFGLDSPELMQPAAVSFADWDDGAPAAHVGGVPEHVFGSDRPRRHGVAVESHPASSSSVDEVEWAYAERPFADEKIADDVARAPETPPAPPTYPSLAGDILAGTHGAEPPLALDLTPKV
jgi:hypothetical protein